MENMKRSAPDAAGVRDHWVVVPGPPRHSPAAMLVLFLATLFLGATLSRPASASVTSFWVSEGLVEFLGGQPEGTAISPEGEVVLAPERTMVTSTEETYLWDLASGLDGRLVLATGKNGRLLEVSPGGEVTVRYEAPPGIEVFCLAVAPGGDLLAGLSPAGLLIEVPSVEAKSRGRRAPDGSSRAGERQKDEADTLAQFEAKYVWNLLVSPTGDIFVATGQPGRIWRVSSADPQPELYFDAADEHVLTLAWDARGALLAGTSPKAIVYQITGPNEGRVLFDAPEQEVKALVVGAGGTVFAGTSGAPEATEGAGTTAKATGPALYRLNRDGTVEHLWLCPEEVLYGIAADPSGGLLITTGNRGKIFRHSATRGEAASVIATLPEPQAVSLLATSAGIYVGTANPAVLYRLGPGTSRQGIFTSRVFDAVQVSRWGSLRWEGETTDGARIDLECRSGNTEDPVAGWSPWAPVRGENTAATVPCPAGRYLQWRARLAGAGEQWPRLLRVKIAYLPPNLPPRILHLEVSESGSELSPSPPGSAPPTLHQILPSGVEVQFSARQSADRRPEEVAPWARVLRTADWEAEDPNEDPLVFQLFYRAVGEKGWKLLAREQEIEGTAYTWNTASFPDGLYQLRLTAGDRPGNPPGEALSAERVSGTFTVDNTPPEITRLQASRTKEGEISVEATARDGGTLVRASYALDGEDWLVVSPADGLCDESEEAFSFRLPDRGAGEHTLVLRVVDEAGNAASRRAVLSP